MDEIYKELYLRGELSWLLYEHQKPIYHKIREVLISNNLSKNSYVIECSRQFGKSFTMLLIAAEECLRKEKQTIVYLAPIKGQANEAIRCSIDVIFSKCPQFLIPKYDGSSISFINGSKVRVAGTDNKNYQNLRGGKAHLALLDEAGFMNDLDNGVLPAVQPMLKTTGGRMIFASTPPDTLTHPFIDILREHDETGDIAKFTIWDDKSLTPETLERIIQSCKGKHTTRFRREFECQRIVESSLQVVPEMSNAADLLRPVEQDRFHQYHYKYVVLDTGIRDQTAAIFAHYNYETRKIVVEDCLSLLGEDYSTDKLSVEIKRKVNQLWPGQEPNYFADCNNLIVINDLNTIYKLPFVPTSKGRLDEMVGKLRDFVADKRILFMPAAEEAFYCATYALWDKNKNQFARSTKYGHYDLLAALIYLVRNVNTENDPRPHTMGFNPLTQFNSSRFQTEAAGANRELARIFGK
jgi:hypothetical protein